jgi:transposase
VAVPLSVDLRSRIVNACKEHTKTDVAKIFQVDRKTVHRYLAQEKIAVDSIDSSLRIC